MAGYFDDTIEFNAMQALDMALERIENTCSTITGVFREKLGGIEQRDAVTNVQVGIRQSTHITKQYFYMMDLVTREILVDILDVCKVVYKKGITGSLILGDRLNAIFTALPEYYTITDFDVHISETSEVLQETETLKQLSFEFTKNNNIDPEIIIDIITSKSLTKMKQDVKTAIKKKRDEDTGIAPKCSSNLNKLINKCNHFLDLYCYFINSKLNYFKFLFLTCKLCEEYTKYEASKARVMQYSGNMSSCIQSVLTYPAHMLLYTSKISTNICTVINPI